MIGKAKSNRSLSATINYNLKKDSVMFYTNKLEGENIDDYRSQMADLQKCYRGSGKSLTIHAQLSPAIGDGKKLTIKEWKKMAEFFLEKLNLDKHQAIGFIHSDKGHQHAHFIINRINDKDFSLYNDSYIGKKTSKAADEIAVTMGLIRAREIEAIKNQRGKIVELPIMKKPIGSKQLFKAALEEIVKQGHRDIKKYFKAIEDAGYEVRLHRDKVTVALRGYGIAKDGTYMDASAIDKKFTIRNLFFDSNMLQRSEEKINAQVQRDEQQERLTRLRR